MSNKNAANTTSPISALPKPFWKLVLLGGGVVAALAAAGLLLWPQPVKWSEDAEAASSRLTLEDIPFDGGRAYEYLKDVCALGRRPSGSEGMAAQQDLLERHFTALGGTVHQQWFQIPHPQTGAPVPMMNLIVQWAPERSERILLCCHYDTLPYPMLDKRDPRGEFIGANDGASGVALLMELGNEIGTILEKHQQHFGVDFVFFDGEEFIFSEDGRYFLGSEYFSRAYAGGNLPYQGRYRWGVLFDMIGDADLQIPQEAYSVGWPETRPLVNDIWSTARRLGVREFVPRRGPYIRDDHTMLRNLGKIPTCDVIDFDYPPWHTMDDRPDQCSALSLAKVGWVIREWLKAAEGGR